MPTGLVWARSISGTSSARRGGEGEGGRGGSSNTPDGRLQREISVEDDMRLQYQRLFDACDVDGKGTVTMADLRSTLFRFGLSSGLDEQQLASCAVWGEQTFRVW